MIVYTNVTFKEIPTKTVHYRVPCFNTIELSNGVKTMVLDSTRTEWSEEENQETGLINASYRIEMNLCEDDCEYEALKNEDDYIEFLKECKITEISLDYADDYVTDYEAIAQTLTFELCNTNYNFTKTYEIKAE